MTKSPSVIVIDDEQRHLDSLAKGLEHFEIPCQLLHFTGEQERIPECPNVRLIFADLHLLCGPPGDHAKDFSVIGDLIENRMKPSGPYLLLLWTKYPDEAPALQEFLERLDGVTKPVEVLPLAKDEYLDKEGHVTDMEALICRIRSLTEGWLGRKDIAGLQGGWKPLENHEVDALVEEIYAARLSDTGRVVELEG